MCNYPQLVSTEGDLPRQVPCGQCMACRIDRSREWATRCEHEIQMHEENCFITLTYNDENLPKYGSLSKEHFQLFMKRLRKHVSKEGKEVRFYACGEYGDDLGRPHYHAIVFGYDFKDKEVVDSKNYNSNKNRFKTGRSWKIFTSPSLEAIWKKGFVTVGEANINSAGYIARYLTKKITGEKAPKYYLNRLPEFSLMSRMPGIGKGWYDKFKTDVYPKDFFTINGKKFKPSRYYDSLLKKENPSLYEEIKAIREGKVEYELPLRRRQKEKHKKLTSKKLVREMETR